MTDPAPTPSPKPSPPAPATTSPQFRRVLTVERKLTLLVGLTLALLLLLTLAVSWLYWRGVLRKLVEAHLSGVAANRGEMVQARVSQLLQRVELNTDRGDVRGFLDELENNKPIANRENSQASLNRMAKTKPIVAAAVADRKGKIVLSTDPAQVGRDVSDQARFQVGLTGPYLGLPIKSRRGYDAPLAAPIRASNDPKRVYGVLLVEMDVSSLGEAMSNVEGLRKTGEVLLGIREGNQFRAFFPPRTAPQMERMPLTAVPAMPEAVEGRAAYANEVDFRGVRVLAASRPIGYRGWALVAKMDESEAYEPVFNLLRLEVLFGLGVGAIGLAAAYFLARGFARPVRELAQAADRVAQGDYGKPVTVRSADEFGALSTSFNEMMAAIRDHEKQRDYSESALRASEENARQVTESLPQLVWTAEASGAWTYVGPQWLEYTGGAAGTPLDAGWIEQLHPEDRTRAVERWKAAVSGGTTFDMQLRVRRQDGIYRWFRARAMPLRDPAGAVVKWFGTNSDIDDAHRAEDALREADRRKDEFLAMLGHELRNPLSAISNAARLLTDATDDPSARSLAHNVIERQTAHLSRLVDDLLDVVRITEGKIELRRSAVNVGEIVAGAVDAMRPRIAERKHEVTVSLPDSALCVDADPMRLEQIVNNLLHNAVKYTPEGGRIAVSVKRDGGDAVISVQDNGAGIAHDLLPEIFEIFTQADRSLERTGGGLGLGLNLCRQLVEIHGGAIAAHSEGLGKGAVFTVRLPEVAVAQPPTVMRATLRPAATHGLARRVLLVDDNKDTIRLLSRLLTRRGHEVFTAENGLTALQMAHDYQPDVLLLDIGLPGIDGYTLARRLRASGFADTPMVAISGYAQESDRELSRDAGFDHHFAKPVDFDALYALLFKNTEEDSGERNVG